MKYAVFGLIAVALATLGGYRAAPSFDYAAATPQARAKWVEDVVGPFASGLNSGLPKGNGLEPHMAVESTKVNADGSAAEIIIAVTGPAQMRIEPSVARRALRSNVCANFMDSAMGQAGVSLTTRFVHPDKGEMFSVRLSKADCAPFAG